MVTSEVDLRITPPEDPLDPEIKEKLRAALAKCPDVAFAHLPQVEVIGREEPPVLALFVWLVPESMGSLRSALNLTSEIVARELPSDRFLDVVILNSAPELLPDVENADCLLVERDAGERRRAQQAADHSRPNPSRSTG
ncbi:MAG: hypothetical protein ACC742_08125 [Thermoanaerobaculales bacterium]